MAFFYSPFTFLSKGQKEKDGIYMLKNKEKLEQYLQTHLTFSDFILFISIYKMDIQFVFCFLIVF